MHNPSVALARGLFVHLGAVATVFAVSSPARASPEAPIINEVRVDQPGADLDEYFEIAAPPGTCLTGLTYVVLGDSKKGGSGSLEAAIALEGIVPATGHFLVSEDTLTLAGADQTAELNFENSDNVTALLVDGFSGTVGQDLDTDDDGALDEQPWGRVYDDVALIETPESGDRVYSDNRVGPVGPHVPAHIFRCPDSEGPWSIGAFATGPGDTPGAPNDCGDDIVLTPIPQIQGTGDISGLEGVVVTTVGVVVADFRGSDALGGFFIQDAQGDGDPATSDGIFVYSASVVELDVGDLVQVTGRVTEFHGLTEIANVWEIVVRETGLDVVPTPVVMPLDRAGDLERYEGMLLQIVSPMMVAQTTFLGRYGQLTLASPDDRGTMARVMQPTDRYLAGSVEAVALADENARRLLILDDGQDVNHLGDNPNPVPYLGPAPGMVLRAGDGVGNLVGVLDFGRVNASADSARDYRLHPVVAPTFTANNPRPAAPARDGALQIASFNVLNYFVTIDDGDSICGPLADQACRGADSESERQRQQAKIVAALIELNADIVGLIEVENNGYGPDSAIATLVASLNEAHGANEYAYVDPGIPHLGGDAITVAIIYKQTSVALDGPAVTLDTGAYDPNIADGGPCRQPLAQTFVDEDNQGKVTVVVNHFKSKRPPSDPQGNGNDDQGDGQGSWNLRRTEAAEQLVAWLATDPTGSCDDDVIMMGDMNAYAKEDPMLVFERSGYFDVVDAFVGPTAYSYIFDGQLGSLDHVIASASLEGQIVGAADWHINADEPAVRDYDESFNPEGYYAADPYRASDHDPIIIGIDLEGETTDSDCWWIWLLAWWFWLLDVIFS